MNAFQIFLVAALTIATSPLAHSACNFPSPPEFSKVATTANRIFVFRVMNLRVREQQTQADANSSGYAFFVEADVLVNKTLRGDTTNITSIHFMNGSCGGVNLLIGHHYLIATTQTDEVIELKLGDRTLGDIDVEYEPTSTGPKQMDSNKYFAAAQAAIEGKQSFDAVLDELSYRSMATVAPPPEIRIVKEPCKKSPPAKHPAANKTIKR
jgi:hypothetical protein